MTTDSPVDMFAEVDADPTASETRMESVEEIRQAVAQSRRTPTLREAGPGSDAQPFRPVLRPPTAMLCILDDGGEDGEWLRLRADKVVIGRAEGQVVIPHDSLMSAKHAELSREVGKAGWRWHLTDLGSTNGVCVRVGAALLKPHQEFLIGRRRFRLHAPPAGTPALPAGAAEASGTRGWPGVAPTDFLPALVELTPQGEGGAFLLHGADAWIGRDPKQCTVALPDDQTVSPRHARLFRDAKGRWRLENAGSRNGTWVRIHRLALDGVGQFQLGEQRFVIRIPS